MAGHIGAWVHAVVVPTAGFVMSRKNKKCTAQIKFELDDSIAIEALILNRLATIPTSRQKGWLQSLLVRGFCEECAEIQGLQQGTGQPHRYIPSDSPTTPTTRREETPTPAKKAHDKSDSAEQQIDQPVVMASLKAVVGGALIVAASNPSTFLNAEETDARQPDMNRLPCIAVGIDDGYAYTKVVLPDGRLIATPSRAHIGQSKVSWIRQAEQLIFEYETDGTVYSVGDVEATPTRFEGYACSGLNRAIVQHALQCADLEGALIKAVSGLPVNSF